METRRLNWVVTLVLSVLFGKFGVDRFMMGQVGPGVLKLLTIGGLGIWWLVDIVLIASRYQFKNVEWEGI